MEVGSRTLGVLTCPVIVIEDSRLGMPPDLLEFEEPIAVLQKEIEAL